MMNRHRMRVFSFSLLLGIAVCAATSPAQETSLKPGINEGYKDLGVEQAVNRFEAENRDVVKKREQIVAACRLEPGMVVADVGAGTGLFTREFAERVAPNGKVYAVDIKQEFVEHVQKTCAEAGFDNVEGIVSMATSAKLPRESADLVFVCDTYHHFEYPFKMLDSIHKALRPDGRLVVVDRKQASDHVRADQETVRGELIAAGFRLIDQTDVSDREYLMHFKRVERTPAGGDNVGGPANRNAPRPGSQQTARLDRQTRVTMDYLIFLPQDYDRKESWPLMLFLHGAGERGDDLQLVKKHGPPKLVETKKDFPFILVSPQCPRGRWWRPNELTALLDEIVAEYKVDEDRVYVTGLSMGGFGTWSLAAHTPKRFAAIVPICGGGEPFWARLFSQVPVWVFHGAKDSVVPLERSERMVEALKRQRAEVKFTVYPEANHDSWSETYDNPELYQWLLKQRRGGSEGSGE